jgi:hypothetical protein
VTQCSPKVAQKQIKSNGRRVAICNLEWLQYYCFLRPAQRVGRHKEQITCRYWRRFVRKPLLPDLWFPFSRCSSVLSSPPLQSALFSRATSSNRKHKFAFTNKCVCVCVCVCVRAVSILGKDRHHTRLFKGARLLYGFTQSLWFFCEGTEKRNAGFDYRTEFGMEMKTCAHEIQSSFVAQSLATLICNAHGSNFGADCQVSTNSGAEAKDHVDAPLNPLISNWFREPGSVALKSKRRNIIYMRCIGRYIITREFS